MSDVIEAMRCASIQLFSSGRTLDAELLIEARDAAIGLVMADKEYRDAKAAFATAKYNLESAEINRDFAIARIGETK